MFNFIKKKGFLLASGVIFSLVGALGIYSWHVSGQLGAAREQVADLRGALTTSEASISKMEEELERRERILSQRDERQRELERTIRSLQEVVDREREVNEAVSDCWDVRYSDDFTNRLRELSTDRDRD